MTEPLNRLDEDCLRILDAIGRLGLPPMHTLSPAEARDLRKQTASIVGGDPEPVASVEDSSFQGPGGPVAIRVYVPTEGRLPVGTLVYFHGGGWVMGNLDTHDALCRGLANASDARVVSVDYRLAPEHPHPSAIEDAWSATLWARARYPGPLAVGGDSAGGHLATTVAARARSHDLELAAQVLIYPVTDLSRLDTRSYGTFAEGYWLTRAAMFWFRDHLLSNGHDPSDPDVSPLLREDLSGMAPAVVTLAECDVLRDEGHAYAQRLKRAGCLTACSEYPGVIHGFVAMPHAVAQGGRALADIGSALRPLLDDRT